MRSLLILVMILPVFSLLSCEKYADPVIPVDSFYFTSFESSSDTAGWYGISSENRVEDAPSVGGRYSVEISGGCVIPHAYYSFLPLTEDCNFVLKCWGKNLSNGGSVSLITENYSGAIHISVSESSWTSYQSEDTLHCLSGDTLRLQLISGGLISSTMLVDQIELSTVE